jgi:uncharacterized membrane protein YeaQ/YmgE (transglycosylase-associated protein family)
MAIIVWLIIGLIAGAVARLLVPGRDPMGWLGTLALGLIGSLVGGLLAVAVTDRTLDEYSASGLLGSIIGGVVALIVYRFLQPHGRLTGRRGARI